MKGGTEAEDDSTVRDPASLPDSPETTLTGSLTSALMADESGAYISPFIQSRVLLIGPPLFPPRVVKKALGSSGEDRQERNRHSNAFQVGIHAL